MALEARTLNRLLRLLGTNLKCGRLHNQSGGTARQKVRMMASEDVSPVGNSASVRTGGSWLKRVSTAAAFTCFSWMSQHSPGFAVDGDKVDVLQEPEDFYKSLKEGITKAKKRIVIASLYLGTGPLEQQLVDALYEALRDDQDGDLQVDILLDCVRGSRGKVNSRTMLLPLLRDFPGKVRVALYHTPNLRGFFKRWLPERFNEVPGVLHLKVYLFDDDLLMSGANLSDNYFTNRQDRSMMLRACPELADFYSHLVSTVAGLSFHLQPDDTLTLPHQLRYHPFEDSDGGEGYKAEAKKRIKAVIDFAKYRMNSSQANCDTLNKDNNNKNLSRDSQQVPDTWVFPLVQMGLFNINMDDEVINKLFAKAGSDDHIKLTSGYFNLTDEYVNCILRPGPSYDILTASPQANGFYGGRGISGNIPTAYTCAAKMFWERVTREGQEYRVKLYEYFRDQWTFHSKGLWYYLPGERLPSMTLIGSPNFGYRSLYKDLESQIALVTDNVQLREQLHQEQLSLYSRSERVTDATFQRPDRQVPLWVYLVVKALGQFG